MAVTHTVKAGVRERPVLITAILTVVGYLLVVGTFLDWFDIYPTLTESQVDVLTHLIAVINTVTLVCLFAGVYFIANREYRKHGIAMFSAFVLILLFLVVYMVRVGGGETKSIIAPDIVTILYLIMLAIHILLSIVSVPVVVYVVLLGLTYSPSELGNTLKARVGRIAAGAWILSLVLGIVTYLLLNHIYDNEPLGSLLLFGLLTPVSVDWRAKIRQIFRPSVSAKRNAYR